MKQPGYRFNVMFVALLFAALALLFAIQAAVDSDMGVVRTSAFFWANV